MSPCPINILFNVRSKCFSEFLRFGKKYGRQLCLYMMKDARHREPAAL